MRSRSGSFLAMASKVVEKTLLFMRSSTASRLYRGRGFKSEEEREEKESVSSSSAPPTKGEKRPTSDSPVVDPLHRPQRRTEPDLKQPLAEGGDAATEQLEEGALLPSLRVLKDLDVRESLTVENEGLALREGIVDVEVFGGDAVGEERRDERGGKGGTSARRKTVAREK
jgi:hypothetical protein